MVKHCLNCGLPQVNEKTDKAADQKLICTDRTFENRVNTQVDAGWRITEVGGVAAPYSASDKRPAREPRVVLWAVLEKTTPEKEILDYHIVLRDGQEIRTRELVGLIQELVAACRAAVEWRGMDGDGVHQPVLGQLWDVLKKVS